MLLINTLRLLYCSFAYTLLNFLLQLGVCNNVTSQIILCETKQHIAQLDVQQL